MKKILWMVGAIALLFLALSSFTFVVQQTEFAVVTQFGRAVDIIDTPGLKFKLPAPINRVNKFDRRLRIFESRFVELLTRDKKNVVLKFFVTWNIENPMLFFESVGNDTVAEQKLDDIVISKGGAALGDYDFEDLISTVEIKIGDLEKQIQANVEGQMNQDYGIRVGQVGISRMALPEANVWSVFNRIRAERKAIANKYRAEGKEQASVIRARADREKSNLIADAYREAQVIRGEGEAEAARIYAEAFQKDPEFYRFWRTLESYKKILDEKTTLVLSDDSELFKYLRK